MNTDTTAFLELGGLTKCYGDAVVVDHCNLRFAAGQVHALLGANGAGKSTLVRMISGLVSPTSGAMTLSGKPFAPKTKREAEEHGIEIVQQELNLISSLSVAENLMLARIPSVFGIILGNPLHNNARKALDQLGLSAIATDAKVGTLGVGQQQMIEIAAALARECRLLILDEPTAALSAAESETLFQWIVKLREMGVGIVYISHRLDEVARLSDRISVLRDGKHVGTYDARELTTDQMIELMGGEPSAVNNPVGVSTEKQPIAMKVSNLSGGIVNDVSFQVQRGEKLGVTGLVGSGRSELLRMIFGADIATRGGVTIGHETSLRRFSHPQQAVAAGLAMVTEDRKENGLLLSQSIRFNTSIASMWQKFSSMGIVRGRTERKAVQERCTALDVRCLGVEQRVRALSGGNQQKIAIAKWLLRDADVFLMDEPTRGIDVAARRRIYQLLDDLSRQGKSCVMVSSDMEELMEVCDRIAVMSNGKLVQTFVRPNWSQDQIMQAAFSNYRDRRPA